MRMTSLTKALLLEGCLIVGITKGFQTSGRFRSIFAGAAMSTASRQPAAAEISLASHAQSNDVEKCSNVKPILYDLPVSNNGARVRMGIYFKKIEDEIDIVSPMDLGGLRSPEYLQVNPQGKMPALKLPGVDDSDNNDTSMTFGESDTILRFICDQYAHNGPSLIGASSRERLLSNAIARHHDIYIGPIQGCMYKAMPPFGIFGNRQEALADLLKQLAILEDMVSPRESDTGPYLAGGTEPTIADCTFFPTAVFIDYMLPKFGIQPEEFFGPTLGKWFYGTMGDNSNAVAKRIREEIRSSLEKWDLRGRWDTIHLAGKRDEAEATIFDKIISKEIPSDIVYEDDRCLAFRDINPVAPTHVLVIPKNRERLTQLRFAEEDHREILGHLLVAAAKVAKLEGFTEETKDENGYRIVINDGACASQSVFHLHIHVIGGRDMTWPPG